NGKELVGKYVQNPVTNKPLPIYPAAFVDPDNGTGIVMSVPGHAPYDYQAIEDLKKKVDLQGKYDMEFTVSPIKIIQSDNYQGNSNVTPAQIIIEEYAIKDQQ